MRKESAKSADFRLAGLAARQHAVLTTAEILAVGISGAGITRRLRQGRLHRKHQGVYAVGHPRLTQHGVWLAAVKACGPEAALSHHSAAQLERILFLADYRGPVHVSVPGTNGVRQRRGIVVHRSKSLAREEIQVRDGIPVTKPARTLTDLRRVLPHERWEDALDRARVLSLPIGNLASTEPTRSRFERRLLALCRRHHLPKPEVNVSLGPFLVDFLWRAERLVVEADSFEHHRDRAAFEADRARDAELRLRGYTLVRFTWRQLTNEPEWWRGLFGRCCGTAGRWVNSVRGAVDATNRNTALASALVEELARCGVRDAVIAPGSRSTPLALALWREDAIDARVIVDERSAGYFALGAAQAGGQPVAVLCTSGTAAANLHPAVCEADESNVPLIVLTADRPPELRGIGAGQTIDQVKLYGSGVRWFCEVGTHDADDAGLLHFRSTACRAYASAAGDPRPGPVHLNVAWRDPLGPDPHPEDVAATSPLALEGRGNRPLTGVPGSGAGAPPPADALVDVMAGHVQEFARGLIVCGRQSDPALAEPISRLARATGYPILAEPTSQLRLGPHDRDLVVSTYDAIVRTDDARFEPEFVLRFGDMPTSKALRTWMASLDGARQLVFDPSYGWNEPTRTALVVMRTDPAALAGALADAVDEGERGDWAATWREAERAAAEAVETALAGVGEPSEPAVHAALGALYGDGEIVYTASSMPIRDQESFVRPGPAAVRFLANRGANGIDGLVSSGAGAASATGAGGWIVTGDLGLFHDMNGLAALRHASAPLRVVVLDNDGGGIFELLPQANQLERHEFEALFGTPLGLEASRIAELHELPHRRVERIDELADAAGGGSALIEVPVDRVRDAELRGRISAAAVAAVAQALA